VDLRAQGGRHFGRPPSTASESPWPKPRSRPDGRSSCRVTRSASIPAQRCAQIELGMLCGALIGGAYLAGEAARGDLASTPGRPISATDACAEAGPLRCFEGLGPS
jgi:hypothetical protein